MTECVHQPVYFGVININVDERTIGSVDVWRCGACRKIFCEEKQLGIEAIADIVGMPRIDEGEKWAVLVCKIQKGQDKWRLVRLGSGSQIMHECLDGQAVPLRVEDHAISDDLHWSFLVDNNVNKAVEISEQSGD